MRGKTIIIDNKITCNKCKETKEVKYFAPRPETGSYRSICRTCSTGSKILKIDIFNRKNDFFNKGLQECVICKDIKSLECFHKNKLKFRGYEDRCIDCNKIRAVPLRKKQRLNYVYNITLEDYENLMVKQNYKCDICGIDFSKLKEKHVHLDHCHASGIIRGILCSRCNHGIGNFNDNSNNLYLGIIYLQKHQDDTTIEYCI